MSFAKVENVVKPPQKPVISSRLWPCDNIPVRSDTPHSSPMMKHPNALTAKVLMGNAPIGNDAQILPVRYRQHVPAKPPHPAISISFIIRL